MKAYIEKRISNKTNKTYTALYIESATGTTPIFIDYITQLKLTNMRPDELTEVKVGEKIYIE